MKHQRIENYPAKNLSTFLREEKKPSLEYPQKFNETLLRISYLLHNKFNPRVSPFAFTEHGVIMLSSVLNSDTAIKVNVQIVRIFIRMREIMISNKEILFRLERMERNMADHDAQIISILDYMGQLEETKQQERDQKNRKRIGFKTSKSTEV